jgi:hypothetical protein
LFRAADRYCSPEINGMFKIVLFGFPLFALYNVRHLFPALDAFPVLHPLARNMQRVRSKRGDFGFCLQPDDEEMRQIKDVLAVMADDVPKQRWERRCRWFIVPCFGRRRLDSARPRHSD